MSDAKRKVAVGEPLYLLYRGPLRSCSYHCWYCPLALQNASNDELAVDQDALERFVHWVRDAKQKLQILFTPWGEALCHAHYQRALLTLSRLPQVQCVVIQTNLSCGTDWLVDADPKSLALWLSFHPSSVEVMDFAAHCAALDARGLRYSVGVVGLQEQLPVAQQLRAALPEHVYLWVNAYKDGGEGYYSDDDLAAWRAIDPHLDYNLKPQPSRGRICGAGSRALSVDGNGDVRRCHFVERVLGNLYRDPLDQLVDTTACPSQSCRCHIGYVHLGHLPLRRIFAGGLLERIPAAWPMESHP